jgi:hypothetical protein
MHPQILPGTLPRISRNTKSTSKFFLEPHLEAQETPNSPLNPSRNLSRSSSNTKSTSKSFLEPYLEEAQETPSLLSNGSWQHETLKLVFAIV